VATCEALGAVLSFKTRGIQGGITKGYYGYKISKKGVSWVSPALSLLKGSTVRQGITTYALALIHCRKGLCAHLSRPG